MKNFRLFFREEKENAKVGYKRSKDGRIHTAMFSDFFSKAEENIFFTNAMYANFMNEVIATINIYHPKEKITLDIYENEESEETKRELALIGFRSYVNSYYQKKRNEFIDQFLQVSLFAIIGIAVIYFLYVSDMPQDWWFYLLQNIGAVFLWQFIGFMAFQYAGLKRELDQLKQISSIEYNFKKWE